MTRRRILADLAVGLALPTLAMAARADGGGAPMQPPGQSPFVLAGLAPRPSLTLYIVVGGEPLTARLSIRQGPRPEGDRLMVRAFDPAERLTFWQYVEAGRQPQTFIPGSSELWGVPLNYALDPKPGDLMFDADIRLEGAGIHQIRVVAGAHNALATFEFPREPPYGVSFGSGYASSWQNPPEAMHVYIPPRAERLNIAGGPMRVIGEHGNTLAETGADLQRATEIPIENTGVVWRVEFPRPGRWFGITWPTPFILCSTPGAARAIRGSAKTLPDGTVVAHAFQKRIAELLPRLLAPENVGDAEALMTPWAERKEAWLAEPQRSVFLLSEWGPLAGLEQALRQQNLDPASHWGGALGAGHGGAPAGWHDFAGRPEPQNRWDRWQGLPGLWGGLSPRECTPHIALARAATLDAPMNPYFGKRELLNRSAAAALRDLMAMCEGELFRYYGEGIPSPYPGGAAFPLGQKALPVYAMVAPHLPGDVREVWTEGLRRQIDQTYAYNLVSSLNQSSHYLVIYQEFFEGSGIARYQDLARAYARRFLHGLHPAGWAEESKGPDATYNGMTHWHMALYYRKSGDEAMAEALRKSYRFFNHTVAPEPEGGALGASNFSHRTLGGFHREQWGGAKGLADHLPEVGLWAAPEPTEEQRGRDARQRTSRIEELLANPPGPRMVDVEGPRYTYFSGRPNREGTWPALERAPFIRDFAGELIAVRRPKYYAAIYVGKPAGEWYLRSRERHRQPYPGGAENGGGEPSAALRPATPFLGGGLSLLSTPQYGNALLAMNWAPTTHHGLIATMENGARHWADYHATEYRLDETAGTLTVTGRIENLPLSYTRAYRFLDDAVEVRLTVVAGEDARLTSLVENIPFARGGAKTRGAELSIDAPDVAAWPQWNAEARGARIRDRQGVGLDIVCDAPQALRVQPEGLRGWNVQIGRLEIQLPNLLRAGQRVELSYRLIPVD